MTDQTMYGNMGTRDAAVVDKHLAKLRKGATVVNLGCGPLQAQHHALASAVGRHQFSSTLILADLNTTQIQNFRAPPPSKIEVVNLNAAAATSVLGKHRADLVLAFGLFGDLSVRTTSEGTREHAWPAVLQQCFELLKPSGKLIVCNSCIRQPFHEFQAAVEAAGFMVSYHHESPSAYLPDNPNEWRYLMECRKRRQRTAA